MGADEAKMVCGRSIGKTDWVDGSLAPSLSRVGETDGEGESSSLAKGEEAERRQKRAASGDNGCREINWPGSSTRLACGF